MHWSFSKAGRRKEIIGNRKLLSKLILPLLAPRQGTECDNPRRCAFSRGELRSSEVVRRHCRVVGKGKLPCYKPKGGVVFDRIA